MDDIVDVVIDLASRIFKQSIISIFRNAKTYIWVVILFYIIIIVVFDGGGVLIGSLWRFIVRKFPKLKVTFSLDNPNLNDEYEKGQIRGHYFVLICALLLFFATHI